MKREDLEKLGLSKEQIDSVMGLHGDDVNASKTNITNLTTERDAFKTQLEDANKQIQGFKGMKTQEEVDSAVNEYKTKYEQVQTEAQKQMAELKFNHALESALVGAKVKNSKAVSALLSTKDLKLTDDGKILGLDEQLTKIKAENDYLFADAQPVPKIVAGTNNQSVVGDVLGDAMRRGANLTTPPK